jgi:excisionase family DNA binding protein
MSRYALCDFYKLTVVISVNNGIMNIEIDDSKLITDIADKVIESLKPLLNSNTVQEDTLFTVESLASYLQVRKQWVYDRVHLNEIPYMKMGKFLRFRKSVIDKWLDKMKTPALQSLPNRIKMVR